MPRSAVAYSANCSRRGRRRERQGAHPQPLRRCSSCGRLPRLRRVIRYYTAAEVAQIVVRTCDNDRDPGDRATGPGAWPTRGVDMDNPIGIKLCRRCQRSLPASQFARNSYSPDGLRSECRSCRFKADRAYLLNARFQLSVQEYEAMLADQDGRCALCRSEKPGGRWNRFAVDHCHETGLIRGLLCWSCNRALGALGDTPVAIGRAFAYVTKYLLSP